MSFGSSISSNINALSSWGGSIDSSETVIPVDTCTTFKKLPKLLRKREPITSIPPSNQGFVEMLPFPYMIPYVGCDMRPFHHFDMFHKESNSSLPVPPGSSMPVPPFPPFYHAPVPFMPPNGSDASSYNVANMNYPPYNNNNNNANTNTATTAAVATAAASANDTPQFGPGPPIVTGEKLKGPRGCNIFVFHLPNEITNW